MESFQNRLKTFKNWNRKSKNQSSSFFAITGFFCTSSKQDDNTTCVFCSKSLEGWEEADIPMEEHYSHNKKCPLFNLNNYISRRRTFEISKIGDKYDAASLSKNGFFSFQLRNMPPDDIFCFKCGFNLDTHSCENLEHTSRSHFNSCPKKNVKSLSFDISNVSEVFYIDLLIGKYNESIKAYLMNIHIEHSPYRDLANAIEESMRGNQLVSVEEALLESLEKASISLEERLSSDVRRALKHFETIVKKYKPVIK